LEIKLKNCVPDFNNEVNRLNTDAEKYESRLKIFNNKKVQPLWVADMDLPSPPFLQEELIKRVDHPVFGYTIQSRNLKDSIIWWMEKEHSLYIDISNILLSPSVVTSFNNAISALSNKGDGVALFSPVYGPFYFAIDNHKRKLIDIPLILENNNYSININKFREYAENGGIKLLLLCNPQNPSGKIWDIATLKELVKISNMNGIIIISDEIHSDIIFSDYKHTSILTIKDAEKCSIVLHSIGKTFNSSALNASFIIVKDSKIKRKLINEAELSHTNDINLLGKIAIKTLLSERGAIYKSELIKYLESNRDYLYNELKKISSINVIYPEATYLIWIDFSKQV
jgi:cystathionine beta-lyase